MLRPMAPPRHGGCAPLAKPRQWHPPAVRYTRVRPLLFALSLALSAVTAAPTFAQSPASGAPMHRLSPAENDAVQMVDAFAAAIVAGQLDAARQFMAPDAVVVVNGQILGNRDAYIDGAARSDAAALRTVERDILRREVSAGPDFGYVVSEKRMRVPGNAKGPSEVVVETMLIARMASGWKITHIHWSGRHAG